MDTRCWGRSLGVLAALIVAPALSAADLAFQINGRPVVLPLSTPVLIDEAPATLADVQALPDGLHVEWEQAAVGPEGVPALIFSYTLIGPVTGNDPLEILGQPVTATADTVVVNTSAPLAAPLGTPFVVAGLVDGNGSVLATLAERRAAGGNRFLLTGPVTAVDTGAGQLSVGNQAVAYAGVSFVGCPATPPPVGSFLSIRATAVSPFAPGSVLGGIQNARCVDLVPPGTVGAAGLLQGLVTAVGAGGFSIGALNITLDANTRFVFGAMDDLAAGVAVSVDGSYTAPETLAATVVEFVRPVVRYTAPLQPADVTPGQSLRPFGIEVRHTAQVRDEDGILALGLNAPTQVEVRGYLDSAGQAHATRVRERGGPDPLDARLRGPVETVAPPHLAIQGLDVDTTGATFADELGAPLTAMAFFGLVQVGHEVDVSGAEWDPVQRRLTGGALVWIGAEPLPPPAAAGTQASIQAGTASGYALADGLLANGFE